jgi:hypothetical protein
MTIKSFLENTVKLDFIGVLVEIVASNTESLTGADQMRPYMEMIKSFREFRNCNLNFMNFPADIIPPGRTITSRTMKINEDVEFTGDCYLYHISLSPTIYNPNTFEPYRGVIVRGVFNL